MCGVDYFEVALLLGSCFLVNYITADAKTNWVEGLIMISFYVMIVSHSVCPLLLVTYLTVFAGCHGVVLPGST